MEAGDGVSGLPRPSAAGSDEEKEEVGDHWMSAIPTGLGPSGEGEGDGADTNTDGVSTSWAAPFRSRGYQLLFLTNCAEFVGRTLAEIGTLVWLFEATRSPIALGYLGIVTLCVQVPSIPIGGVLADELDRRRLIAAMQGTSCLVTAVLCLLLYTDVMMVFMAYVSVGVLQLTSQLENSARGALTAAVVSPRILPRAVSTNVITSNFGEVLAPMLFFLLAGGSSKSGGGSGDGGDDRGPTSLALVFLVSSCAYAVATILPLMIKVGGEDMGTGEDYTGDGGGSKPELGSERHKNEDEAKMIPSHDGSPAGYEQKQPKPTLASRYAALIEGVRYILGHPLLPGLYALDWGMTLVSFYRELFPMFVAHLLTEGRDELGLSERGAVSILTSVNFLGGIAGGLVTFRMQDCDDHYGAQVVVATLLYGGGCILFGSTSHFLVGCAAVFWCGACDAVGAAMRNIVVMLTTPDHLRGRARSGHSLAANVANSLGQLYVAGMATVIGAGYTMILGGVITFAAVGFSVYLIPALLSHRGSREITFDCTKQKIHQDKNKNGTSGGAYAEVKAEADEAEEQFEESHVVDGPGGDGKEDFEMVNLS